MVMENVALPEPGSKTVKSSNERVSTLEKMMDIYFNEKVKSTRPPCVSGDEFVWPVCIREECSNLDKIAVSNSNTINAC